MIEDCKPQQLNVISSGEKWYSFTNLSYLQAISKKKLKHKDKVRAKVIKKGTNQSVILQVEGYEHGHSGDIYLPKKICKYFGVETKVILDNAGSFARFSSFLTRLRFDKRFTLERIGFTYFL